MGGQEFHVLKCFSCGIFQVHIVKKTNKWQCKLCGSKQSIRKVYGRGSAKDCRLHTQKLNALNGEKIESSLCESNMFRNPSEPVHIKQTVTPEEENIAPPNAGKWAEYIAENIEEINYPTVLKRKKNKVISSPNIITDHQNYSQSSNSPINILEFRTCNKKIKTNRNDNLYKKNLSSCCDENEKNFNSETPLSPQPINQAKQIETPETYVKWVKYLDEESNEIKTISANEAKQSKKPLFNVKCKKYVNEESNPKESISSLSYSGLQGTPNKFSRTVMHNFTANAKSNNSKRVSFSNTESINNKETSLILGGRNDFIENATLSNGKRLLIEDIMSDIENKHSITPGLTKETNFEGSSMFSSLEFEQNVELSDNDFQLDF